MCQNPSFSRASLSTSSLGKSFARVARASCLGVSKLGQTTSYQTCQPVFDQAMATCVAESRHSKPSLNARKPLGRLLRDIVQSFTVPHQKDLKQLRRARAKQGIAINNHNMQCLSMAPTEGGANSPQQLVTLEGYSGI